MGIERHLPASVRGSVLGKVAASTLVVLIVVGGVAAVVTVDVTGQLQEQRRAGFVAAAEQEAESLSLYFEEKSERSILISKDADIVTASSTAQLRGALQDVAGSVDDEEIHAIHYIDRRTMTIRASSRTGAEGTSIEALDVPWRGELSFDTTNDVVTSRVHVAPDGETEVIAFVSPVEGRQGLVAMLVDAGQYDQGFSDTTGDGSTQVVGPDGVVEFAQSAATELTRYQDGADATELRRGAAGETGVLSRGGTVVAYAPAEGTDLVVVKRVPRGEAYALADSVRTSLLGIVGAIVVGVVALGGLVHWSVLTPIRRLTARATAVAEGDLDTTVEDEGRADEVGDLRDAFHDTLEYLRTVAGQAEAIADQEFDAAVLDERVPGDLGTTLDRMQTDVETFIEDVERARAEAEASEADAEEARAEAERARAEAQDLAESLRQRAEQFGATLDRAAEGDLSQRLDTDVDNEAMRAIAASTNEMLADIERAVREITAFAAEVDDRTDRVTATVGDIETTSQEVSQSVQQIADGAERQEENVETVSAEMTDLSTAIEAVATATDEIANTSRAAAEAGEEGRARASDAVDVMNGIESQAKTTVDEVERLEDDVDRIGEVVNLIDDIAEQTNLLALNAAIEAARADEASEGFAVVAEEIKSLASQTDEATEEVAALVDEVQTTTDGVADDIREMRRRVDDGIDTVEGGIEALERIVERVEQTDASIQSIGDAVDEQTTAVDEAVSAVDEARAVSEQTVEQTDAVAAAAEEQTASITQVTENIEALSAQATDLRRLLDEFDVDADAGPGPAVGGATSMATDDD